MGKNTMNGCRVNWLAALFSLVLACGRGRGRGGVRGKGGKGARYARVQGGRVGSWNGRKWQKWCSLKGEQ